MAYAKINSITNANMAKVNNAAKAALGKIANIDAPSAVFSNTKSIDFDGTDDFLVSTADLDGAVMNRRTKSFSFWWKSSNEGTGSNNYILTFGAGAMAIQITYGDIEVWHNTHWPSFAVHHSHRSAYLDTGNWHHIVFTVSCPGGINTEAVHKVYVDAVEKASSTYTRNQTDYATGKFSIGASAAGGAPIEAQIDEVGWWDNVALDADAITALYNSGEPIDLSTDSGNYDNSSALVHWWRMGDGDTYPTIEDNEGSLDLTMTNMVSGDIEEDVPS